MTLPVSARARAPGVFVQLVDPPPPVEPVRVDVPAFVCVCERGPVDAPVRVGSRAQFALVFGGFVSNGLGAYAVKAFFDQGGRVCWVVRVAAPEVTTTATAPQPTDRSTTVPASTTGFVVGAAATLRQGEEVHTYLITGVDAGTATVTWDRELHPDLDTTVSMTLSTAAGSASARLHDRVSVPVLEVQAASPGGWGNALEIVAAPGRRQATSSRIDDFSSLIATPVESTAGLVPGDLVRFSQQVGGVVTAGSQVVERIDHDDRIVWWQSPLPASLDLGTVFALETESTSLTVLEHGSVKENWPDLSMRPEHPRYAEAVVAASRRIIVVVLGATAPVSVRVALRGGRDGTAGLTVADLIGDDVLADGRGVAALLGVEEPAVLALPDLVGTWTPPVVLAPPTGDPCDPCAEVEAVPARRDAMVVDAGARFDTEEIVRAQQSLIESCERNTERIVLLDPPTAGGTPVLADLRAWAARFSSSYAVAVVPWVSVVDPRSGDGRGRGAVRRVPACGHLAGMIAQTDAMSGPWLSPANRSLTWAHGVDVDFGDEEHAIANEAGMLVVRALPGRGLVPLGGRTLSPEALWTFLSVRRTLIYLRRTLRVHLAWTVFEPNDALLARTIESAVSTLMEQLWEAGALVGAHAEAAYALQVDHRQVSVGQLMIVLGVALARPAEFITLRVSRTDNRLEITEMPQVVRAGVAS